MTTHNNNNDVQPQPAAANDAVQARRRFMRTGATGAVLTLASGSGMAAVCSLPSGNMSGAARASKNDPSCTGGYSPGYWKKKNRPWPAGISRDTPFGDVFPSVDPYKSTTLGIMVTQEDPRNHFDDHNLGCHFVASYLNIAGGSVTFMKLDDLKRMWNELRTFSEYVPKPNADPWDAVMVRDYLESTYHSKDGG